MQTGREPACMRRARVLNYAGMPLIALFRFTMGEL